MLRGSEEKTHAQHHAGTLTFQVQAMAEVAKKLNFELGTMMSRGFSVSGTRGGEWVVTWMGREVFLVDLVTKKITALNQ